MLLAEVIGHSRAKRILQNALAENRVAHAYLFYGPAGAGKTTLAGAFAGALLCRDAVTDACGKCLVCRRAASGRLPDFFEVKAAGNKIKIEQVRELQRKVQFKPYEASRKVYLISQAEMMTRDAANCLLKILEDPPPHTVFLLTAVNHYNLPSTVISRCQMIPLGKTPLGEIEKMLLADCRVDLQTAKLLASLSNGLPGLAKDLADSGKSLQVRELMFDLAERIINKNPSELLKTAEEFEKRKEILPEVFEQLLLWYRDQLIWLQTGEANLIINIDKLNYLQNLVQTADPDYLISSITDILGAKKQMEQNVNLRLILEVLLLRLARTA